MKYVYCFLLALVSNNLYCAVLHDKENSANRVFNLVISKDSFKDLETECSHMCGNKTLWIFDIDDTIVEGHSYLSEFESDCFITAFDDIWNDCKKLQSCEAAQSKFEKLMVPLVDTYAPELIAKLQSQNIKAILLTLGGKGKRENMDEPNYMRWRSRMLAKCGIDLSKTFPTNEHEMKALGTPDDHPVFYNGILFASPCKKGQVLLELFKTMQWYPEKIVYVDNDPNQVYEIDTLARSLKMSSLGVIFSKNHKKSNFNVFDYLNKVRYLIVHNTWQQ